MINSQNFIASPNMSGLNFKHFSVVSRSSKLSRFALGLVLLCSTAELTMAAPRDTQNNADEVSKPQANNSKSNTDAVGVNMDENIRLRRDLDEYSRSVDPAHVQIEERRRVMHKRLQERFNLTDRDNDGTISLEEAYDTMPQLARHFGEVDLNNDRLITLEELEALQAKIAERQRVVTVKADTGDNDTNKRKGKEGSNSHKSAI